MKIINIGSGSSGNAYIVSDGKTDVLIEAGLSLKHIIRRGGKIPRFCLISHRHEDHSGYVKDLQRHAVEIFTVADVVEKYGLNCKPVEPMKIFTAGSFNIMPFEVEHDVPAFGYILASTETGEQLLFVTDTYFIRYRFANLTHILIECNFDRETIADHVDDRHLERVFESHMSLQDLKMFFEANDLSKVDEIYLCHMSEDNLDPVKAKREIQETTGLPVYCCKKDGGFE